MAAKIDYIDQAFSSFANLQQALEGREASLKGSYLLF